MALRRQALKIKDCLVNIHLNFEVKGFSKNLGATKTLMSLIDRPFLSTD
jgi:hypothetical protein